MPKLKLSLAFSPTAIVLLFALISLARPVYADSYLFYKEAQLVFGRQANPGQWLFYSQSPDEAMQKPSLGFDYIYRFSGDTGDRAAAYLQGRLALTQKGRSSELEPQLYNAFINFKNPIANLWVGHNKVSYGINSYLDSHALLLPTLGMYDFGFDYDWGVGLRHDYAWGDLALALTSLLSGRLSYGVLNEDGYNLGLSKANGTQVNITGIDAAYLFKNYEFRAEGTAGLKGGSDYRSFLVRGGIKILEEEKLKIELQYVAQTAAAVSEQISSIGLSYLQNQELTWRFLYQADERMNNQKIVAQIYYYAPW